MRPYIWLAVASDLTAKFAYFLYHQDGKLVAWLEEIGYIDLEAEEDQ